MVKTTRENVVIMNVWISEGLFSQVVPSLFPVSSKTINGVKWGYMNPRGKVQINQIFDQAMEFQADGIAVVGIDGKYGLINYGGNFVVKPIYNSISDFSEGRAQVIDEEGFKVIDTSGKVLTSKAYSFIGSFENGRALFGEALEDGPYLYGFLDRQGKEVVPAEFLTANEFQDDKAIVQLSSKEYALINKNGKVLHKYPYPFVGNLGEGLLAFKETEDGKFGFIDVKGTIVIPPKFTSALPFEHGRAIVNMAEDYRDEYGLIDKEGNFIYPPVYNDIHHLGKNRVAIGKAIKKGSPFYGSNYALGTTDGTVLTEFKYLTILEFKEGAASVTTGKETYFINKLGKMAKRFPVLNGEGTLTLEGDLIKANIDQRITYYDAYGNIIWRQNKIIPINQRCKVIEKKYKPNKDYLVYYPQIEGMSDTSAGQKVNEELKSLSQVKPIQPDIQLDSSYTGDFSIKFYKDQLLVIEIEGYDYPFGAAHGMPYRAYAHINLVNGDLYKLADLFKKDSDYVKVLSDIIAKQIKEDDHYSYVFPDSYKGISADQPFFVEKEALYLYFEPYEIGPYAAGFPTFKIPFDAIKAIINTEGEFWKSFH